jgi:hypothetical protein
MDESFLQDRIDATKATILLYEAAINFLVANPTSSYKLDTGQSVQDVTRVNLPGLQTGLDSLLNRLVTLGARQNGAATQVRPCF